MWALLAGGGSRGCPRGGQRAPGGRAGRQGGGREAASGGGNALPQTLGARARCGGVRRPPPSELGGPGAGLGGAAPGALRSAPAPDWQGQLNGGPGGTLGGRARRDRRWNPAHQEGRLGGLCPAGWQAFPAGPVGVRRDLAPTPRAELRV